MSLDLENVAAQKRKNDEQNALIAALVELSRSCPQYYHKQFDAYIADGLVSAVQKAFSSNSNTIGKLQNEGKLHGYISALIDLKNKEEAPDFKGKKILAEIRTDVLDAVLRESKRQEIPSTLPPIFTTIGCPSSLFKKTTIGSNAKYGAIAFGGVLTGVGILTTLALLAKSSAAVSTAVAVTKAAALVATAASSAFPPALIGIIAIGVTAALLAATILAIAAIKHYHNKETRKLVDEFTWNRLKN